ncbi:hypothetical protein ACE38W_04330 [Chitinophaga sp. Hz27]|uniref:hypothetical protein n=1 Tax=Chitinophaga sp. Hz27 TaxID=3347169 RepID=UPI0035DE3FEC
MEGFLSSWGFLLLVFVLWGLYSIKCTGYVMKVMQLPQYFFLYSTLGCIETPQRRRIWLRVQFLNYLPVFIYGLIAAAVGFWKHYYIPASLIIVFNIIMCVWPLPLFEKKLWQPDVFFFSTRFSRWLDKLFVKPPVLYFFYELFTVFPRKMFLTKLWSALVLWLTFFLMSQSEFFDLRALQLGVIMSVLMHTQLMLHHRAFDEIYLNWLQNLPISTLRHYSRVVGMYIIMYIPETIMLLCYNNHRFSITDIITAGITGISLLLIFRVLLYFPKMNAEIHFRWILVISFVLLFMILGYLTWYAIVLLQLIAALTFFKKYRRYEPWLEMPE